MAENSKIQWTTHTMNPWRGCTKVSAGCAHCYAEALGKRNPKVLGVWGPAGTRVVAAEARWREPLAWDAAAKAAGERHRVFCASLADVFEGPETMPAEAWPKVRAARVRLFHLISETPNLDWLLLTKRPQNVRRFCEAGDRSWSESMPPNVWLGTSVEDQAAAEVRVPELLKIPAAVRFLSCEPLLGPVSLTDRPWWDHRSEHAFWKAAFPRSRPPVDWVIVGGESGGGARPFDPAWARSLRDQCRDAGVAVFVKQVGSAPVGLTVRGKGGEPADIPADLLVREFPAPAGRA